MYFISHVTTALGQIIDLGCRLLHPHLRQLSFLYSNSVARQAWAWVLSPAKCRLPPLWNGLVKNRSNLMYGSFQILMVSAVKICKHCQQTASASGELGPQTPTWASPLVSTGGPRPPGLNPLRRWTSLASPLA